MNHFAAVKSFVEVTHYLLKLPNTGPKYVLSDKFSQDCLENYFGKLRSKGGWCDNPTVKACLDSAQSLRVQGSMSMEPIRGNSSRKRHLFHGEEVINDKPLSKKPRYKKGQI